MKFSVIIPLYNKAPYVAKAIDSVLSQTLNDYELIIVDDGSLDHSAEIAMQAIEGRDNCRLLRQENTGVSAARNNGVAASQGDYLCFLDADDWWEPMFLEEMSTLMASLPDAGIYGTNYTIVNETKHKTRVAQIGVEQGFEQGYINYCKVYAETMYMPLWTGAVCVPRRVFDEMNGFPEDIKLGEDFLLWIRIALKYKVAFLNKALAYYNQDVEAGHRATSHLVPPEHNFLWHLGILKEAEHNDPDCKLLLDRLRGYDLQPYYLSRQYHEASLAEIKKIDERSLVKAIRRFYLRPLAVARLRSFLRKYLSKILQRIKAWIDKLASNQWEVGVVEGGIPEIMSGHYQVKWLQHNYKDRWFADPFILEVNENTIVLLVEEYLYELQKGRIAKLVVDRKTMQVTNNTTLLEKPTHLSFPAILRIDGKVFVYPENSASGRLDLYEYRNDKLLYFTTLCDEPLTDAVITDCFKENRIYATKMPLPNGNTIGLYRSGDLCGIYGLCNTIEFTDNDARMAGNFFEYKGGIYKPSQNCSGKYGKAIHLYRTDDGLSFQRVSELRSTHPRLHEGMHTLNGFQGVAVVDVVGYKYNVAGRVIKALVWLKKRVKR